MRERRIGPRAEDDLRAAARRQLAMPADEIGVQVRLDDVADRSRRGAAPASRY